MTKKVILIAELKAARIAAGLTQQQVADKMGIAQNAISRIEAGTHSPSLDMVERYADALGLQLALTNKLENY